MTIQPTATVKKNKLSCFLHLALDTLQLTFSTERFAQNNRHDGKESPWKLHLPTLVAYRGLNETVFEIENNFRPLIISCLRQIVKYFIRVTLIAFDVVATIPLAGLHFYLTVRMNTSFFLFFFWKVCANAMPLFMEMRTETDFAYLLVQIVETPLKFNDITKLCIDEP